MALHTVMPLHTLITVYGSCMVMSPPHVTTVYAHSSPHLPKKVTKKQPVNHIGSSDEPPTREDRGAGRAHDGEGMKGAGPSQPDVGRRSSSLATTCEQNHSHKWKYYILQVIGKNWDKNKNWLKNNFTTKS